MIDRGTLYTTPVGLLFQMEAPTLVDIAVSLSERALCGAGVRFWPVALHTLWSAIYCRPSCVSMVLCTIHRSASQATLRSRLKGRD